MIYEKFFCKISQLATRNSQLATRNSQLATRNSQLATVIALSSALLLTACGGCDSNDDTNTTVNSNSNSNTNQSQVTPTQQERGQFIDSFVGNVDVYQNGQKVATTDAEGYFNYTKGSEVTFKIGKLTLGSTMPKAIITPADLAVDKADVVEILQTLQSLDEDKNPDNNIWINVETANKLVTEANLSDKKVTLADTVQKDIPNIDIVAEDKAVEHFAKAQEQLKSSEDLSKVADNLVGYWQQSCNNGALEVFELAKSSTEKNVILGVGNILKREFENNDCTGNYREIQKADDISLRVQIASSHKQDDKTIIKTIRKETKNGNTETFFDTMTMQGNTLSGDNLVFTRRDSLSFDDSIKTEPADKSKADKLVGYWKFDCYDADEGDGSKRVYMNIDKNNQGNLIVNQLIQFDFSDRECLNKVNARSILSEISSQDIPAEWLSKGKFSGNDRYLVDYGRKQKTDENGNVYESHESDNFTRISANEFPSL